VGSCEIGVRNWENEQVLSSFLGVFGNVAVCVIGARVILQVSARQVEKIRMSEQKKWFGMGKDCFFSSCEDDSFVYFGKDLIF